MITTPKICVLGATFATKNMGVSALTAGIIQCIFHIFSDAEIFLLDYGREKISYHFPLQEKTVPLTLLNMRFSKNIYLENHIITLILLSLIIRILPGKKIKNKIISNNEILKQINESAYVVSIAAGDSFSDIYGIERFFYVSLPQLLVLFMRKKLILLPQTLGPFKTRLVRFWAGYILNKASLVYSRDNYGLEEMQKFLGKKFNPQKYKLCYDVGFIIDPKKPTQLNLNNLLENKEVNSNIVGLNVSGLLYRGGYTGDNMFGLKIDYKDLIYDLIDYLIEKRNFKVLLIPHVMGFSEDSESDTTVCTKIYDNLKAKYGNHIFVVKDDFNQNEIKYIIGLCDFFIGSRMHACIAALSQNIPAISIAYSKKFKGVMQTINIESLVADPREMTKEEILNTIAKGVDDKESIKNHLEQITPRVKATVLNIFNEISII